MGQKKSTARKDATATPTPPPPEPAPRAATVDPIKPLEPQAAQKTEEKLEPKEAEFEETALMYTSRPDFQAPTTPKPAYVYESSDNIITAASSYLAVVASQSRFRLSHPLPPPPKLQLVHDIPITAN